MNKPFYLKPWFIVIAVLVILGIIGNLLKQAGVGDKPGNNIEKIESKPVVKIELTPEQLAEKAKKDSLDFISDLQFDLKKYDSLSKVDFNLNPNNLILVLQRYQDNHIAKSNNSLLANKFIQKLYDKEKNALQKCLKKHYNDAREAIASSLNETMFANNIKVDYDSQTRRLRYTGAIFANNANKLSAKKTFEEAKLASLYRFDQLSFRWYDYDAGTTWEYKNIPADDEIIKGN
jgi:hypothetical protein